MNEKYTKKKATKESDSRIQQDENRFQCEYCHRSVDAEVPGTRYRNHCPWCLRSLHLDEQKGDRGSPCGGIMEPIAVAVRPSNEWVLIHRCTICGVLKENRIAGDDNEVALLSLAVRPVAQPPFPLDGLYLEKRENNRRRKS